MSLDQTSSQNTDTAAGADTQIHSSDPGFKETLNALSKPLEPGQIKRRSGGKNQNGSQNSFEYVEWHTVAKILDDEAPSWNHSIKNIQEIGALCVITVAISIDGVSREGIGTGSLVTETGIKKAEHDALKRAAVKFGIARELYKKEIDAEASAGRSSFNNREFDINNPPRPSTAASEAERITHKQADLIFKHARELDMDVGEECGALFGNPVDELNKRAASWFITYLETLVKTARETGARTNVVNIRQPSQPSQADHVTPETRGRLLFEAGAIKLGPDGYEVTDTIKGVSYTFKVRKQDSVVTCECGDYKNHALAGENGYQCAHKMAVRQFAAVKEGA